MAYVSSMHTFCFFQWFSKVIIIIANTFRVEPKHHPVYHGIVLGITGFFLLLLFVRSGLPKARATIHEAPGDLLGPGLAMP